MTYSFNGDLLIAPGHGSIEDGFLEFFPRTFHMENFGIQFISQGGAGSGYIATWPPENDPNIFPPQGRSAEIWHSLSEDFEFIVYPPGTMADIHVNRALMSGGFDFHGIRRYTELGLNNTEQVINHVSTCFWDISELPAGARVIRAELVGHTIGTDVMQTLAFDWITGVSTGPDGHLGWLEDYSLTVSGNAFAERADDAVGKYPNPMADTSDALQFAPPHMFPLEGAESLTDQPRAGLKVGFLESEAPPQPSNWGAGIQRQTWQHFTQWESFEQSGDPVDAEFALGEIPCLRLYFDIPEEEEEIVEPDEPVTLHLARQLRARRSMLGD